MSEEEDDTIVAVKETNDLDILTKNDHSAARRVASNNSVGSLEGNNQQHVSSRTSKKMSVTSTLSNASSDQPYISMMSDFNRNRKVSEGLPPFISLLSQNDAESDPSNQSFQIIEEESWRGQNKIYGPQHGMRSAGNKKITRQRKEIFPGYEKIVQDRTKMTEEKLWQEDDENDDDNILETKNPDNLNPSALSERRSSCNPTTSSSCEMPERQLSSDPDLKSHFSRRGLRATVCNAQLNKHRNLAASAKTTFHTENSSTARVTRSSSMKKPFVKIGDGFIKTFRNLKKK